MIASVFLDKGGFENVPGKIIDLRQSRRHENHEPPKADDKQVPPKGALRLLPGPGSRALPAEIMRHLLLSGLVGPTGLGSPWWFPPLV